VHALDAADPSNWWPPSKAAMRPPCGRSSKNAEYRRLPRVRPVARLRPELLALLVGPSTPDRILALDTLYINAIALLVLLGIHLSSALYFEAALLIA